MRARALLLGIVTIAIATATYVHVARNRGVKVITGPETADGTFNRAQSTGLFVGVRDFDEAEEVPYAVDDAVDLAHMFTLDARATLLPPRNVVLAISGEPQKPDSQTRLRELIDAGVTVKRRARARDIAKLLEQQSAAAGRNGILVFALATHGFIDLTRREPFILGSDSSFDRTRSAVRLDRLIETASRSAARRSLLLIDACRDRYLSDTRGARRGREADPPPLDKMIGKVEGQVIFYAAPAGEVTYNDRARRNGIFTRAVLEGLSCDAATVKGVITAGNLRAYVNRTVLRWVRENKEPHRKNGIHSSLDGGTETMPLAICSCPPCTPLGPADVEKNGSEITAIGADNKPTWTAKVEGNVADVLIEDLDANHSREVIVRVDGHGADAGKVVLFDAQGRRKWTAGDAIHEMTLGAFTKHKHHVVTLSRRLGMTHLSIIDISGNVVQPYATFEDLQNVLVERPSNLHDPRIVLAGAKHLYLIDPPPKLDGKWRADLLAIFDSIRRTTVIQRGKKREIAVETKSGKTAYVPFAEAPKEMKAIPKKKKKP